jgi:hypothetical protein
VKVESNVISQASAIGAPAPIRQRHDLASRRERLFFGGMAVACTLTVLAGFSRSYYMNAWVESPFELTPLLHWHGAVFTAWMMLLVTQTSLVAANRRDLHRRLGMAGVGLGLAMIVLGPVVAVSRTASGLMADLGPPPLVFLAVPLVGIVVFAALFGAALYFRHRDSAAHKRLMLLATLELVTAGVSRLPLVESLGPLGFFGVTNLFVVAIAAYDLMSRKRLHAATLWGGLFLVASQPLRLMLGGSALWIAFAGWLTS